MPDRPTQYPHPLIGTRPGVCLRLLARHGFDAAHVGTVAQVFAVAAMTMPRRLIESSLWHQRIADAQIQPPLFIIGHWRSGTTHLHNLLSQDPQFAPVTYLHCAAAGILLSQEAYARRRIGEKMPATRPMDEVALTLDSPAEEELALSRITDTSFYHCFFFPRHARQIFRQSVLLESLTPARLRRWEERYLRFLRKVSLATAGRQILLKNPANTARLRHILRLFPNARFIHIYRNPYAVYPSTRNLWSKLLGLWSLHHYDMNQIGQDIFDFYQQMMPRYFEDAKAIPPGQLTEIRFEDLDANPIPTLERIYADLHLSNFHEARPRIATYLSALTHYRRNTFPLDPGTIQRITSAWGFAAHRWGYEPTLT